MSSSKSEQFKMVSNAVEKLSENGTSTYDNLVRYIIKKNKLDKWSAQRITKSMLRLGLKQEVFIYEDDIYMLAPNMKNSIGSWNEEAPYRRARRKRKMVAMPMCS